MNEAIGSPMISAFCRSFPSLIEGDGNASFAPVTAVNPSRAIRLFEDVD